MTAQPFTRISTVLLLPTCLLYAAFTPDFSPAAHLFRSFLSGLLGLGSSELLCGSILLGLLCAADGADTGDGVLTEVSTVAILCSLIGNALVDP